MWSNVFYFQSLNVIGGIEQFFAYLANEYADKDITIVYSHGNRAQVQRLERLVRVVRFHGETIRCKKVFFCFNRDIRGQVVADEYNLILHGDYEAMVEQGMLDPNNSIFADEFDNVYGVSQTVCDSWQRLTGRKCELVYNPFIKEAPKNILRLVYCGRLTPEKGGDLIEKLISALGETEYVLYVYSNVRPFNDPHVVYMGVRLDAGQFLNPHNYDYVLVPSKNEGYCYTLVQALSNGLPAVITPCPVFNELGANEKNTITLEFDGSNCEEVVKRMLKGGFDFHYTPKHDTWSDILVDEASTYTFVEKKEKPMVQVRRGNVYLDVSDEQIKEYLAKGFDVIDESGAVVEASVPNDVNELKKAFTDHLNTIEQLQAENEQLRGQLKARRGRKKS